MLHGKKVRPGVVIVVLTVVAAVLLNRFVFNPEPDFQETRNEIQSLIKASDEELRNTDLQMFEDAIKTSEKNLEKVKAEVTLLSNKTKLTAAETKRLEIFKEQLKQLGEIIEGHKEMCDKIRKGEKYSRPWDVHSGTMDIK